MNAPVGQKHLVIVGGSGMVGGYALRYALDHPAVGRVTAIGRRKVGLTHPKLNEVLHQDFANCSALAPVFDDLNRYAATMHFVGQSTIQTLTGDRATGEAYTLAHHLTVDGGKRSLMIAALRYDDTFVKTDGAWLFAERKLYVDWLEERALS